MTKGHKNLNASNIASEENVHAHYEQKARQKRALDKGLSLIFVDTTAKTALFQGSAKDPYKTSLHECTCIDFQMRNLPCKHIYRLMHELGLIDLESLFPLPNKEILKVRKDALRLLSFLKENWEFLPVNAIEEKCSDLVTLKTKEDSLYENRHQTP